MRDIDPRLAVILENRRAEIDLFWRRTTIFWGFNAAALAALAAANAPFPRLLAGCVGAVSSVAWSLVNRGSKYWQETWERRAASVSDDGLKNVFGTREPRAMKGWWLSSRRYSVSKVTIAVSDYFVLLWVLIGARQLALSFGRFEVIWVAVSGPGWLFASATLLYILAMLVYCRTTPDEQITYLDVAPSDAKRPHVPPASQVNPSATASVPSGGVSLSE